MSEPFNLEQRPVHLGLGATVLVQEPFTGMDWYARYGARNAADGLEGRLVSVHAFEKSWESWEMHPQGEELVVCLSGRLTLRQQFPDGREHTCTLEPHQAIINPRGVWHIAEVEAPAVALFVTAGAGTEHRPR